MGRGELVRHGGKEFAGMENMRMDGYFMGDSLGIMTVQSIM